MSLEPVISGALYRGPRDMHVETHVFTVPNPVNVLRYIRAAAKNPHIGADGIQTRFNATLGLPAHLRACSTCTDRIETIAHDIAATYGTLGATYFVARAIKSTEPIYDRERFDEIYAALHDLSPECISTVRMRIIGDKLPDRAEIDTLALYGVEVARNFIAQRSNAELRDTLIDASYELFSSTTTRMKLLEHVAERTLARRLETCGDDILLRRILNARELTFEN